MFPPTELWNPQLDWTTEAGRALTRMIDQLPRDRDWLINVFGSAPLQMGLEPTFASGDVDVFTRDDWREIVLAAIRAAGLEKRETEFYVQCVPEAAFRTSRRWTDRAHSEERQGVRFRFAHPIDILIGKLNRLAPKDINAFELVMQKTGHPTEAELIQEFQRDPDLFSFGHFSPFGTGSFWGNVLILWRKFFHREINVQREILDPGYARIREAYEVPDLTSELRSLVEDVPPPPGRGT